MRCLYCSFETTRVVETRETSAYVRRRRECMKCTERFTTYERSEMQPLRVIKRGGTRELFDRNKLEQGLLRACQKRPVSDDEISEMLDAIEKELRKLGKSDIPSSYVGEVAMQQLLQYDEVAYVRFASVYKEFSNLKSFEKVIRDLKKP